MEEPAEKQSLGRTNTIMRQLVEKRDDTPFHLAVRAGELDAVLKLLDGIEDGELKGLLSKQNQSGETALYVAAESGNIDIVKEMVKYYDTEAASIKARNGLDAFHIAAKQGDLEVVKVLVEALPEVSMTFDQSNTTALHTAAEQGHIDVVDFLLQKNRNMVAIRKSNLKTALHSCARKGHLEVVKILLSKEPELALWTDKKGQTALHMAVKGTSVEVVNELIASADGLINIADGKNNTALHIATRKSRTQIVQALLSHKGIINTEAINKSGETALDTAEKFGRSEITTILKEHGVANARSLTAPPIPNPARELKQTVSEIKHEVHDQLEHTLRTQKRVRGIGKRLNKMHIEGLNNAISSTTVVAVLIATVTFAAIFTLPGQYVDDPKKVPSGLYLGEANMAMNPEFIIFLLSDSIALFISLAVVVVQTSIVIVERRAKKQVMAIINKLMWLACVFVSVAFLALSFIVVGNERWLAVGVTVIGTVTLASTLGTLCYWVIMHRIEASNLRSNRRSLRSARSSLSHSWSVSVMSDSENDDYKNLYAI